MSTGFIPTIPLLTFTNAAGVPAVGYNLTTYAAGTTSLQNTWQDSELTILNTNPIVLDAMGQCVVWFNDLAYKFVLTSPSGSVVWSLDNIAGAWPSSGNIVVPEALLHPETHTGPLVTNGTDIYWVDGPIGWRNRIFNGNFLVDQRQVTTASPVVLEAGTYGVDRWMGGPSGCTFDYTMGGSGAVVTITSGSLIQWIEGKNMNMNPTYIILTWVGTSLASLDGGVVSSSPITMLYSSIGAYALRVEFFTGTVSLVQLEVGRSPTVFENRPFTFELALCQRYYEKSYDYLTQPGTITYAGCFPIRAFITSQTVFDLAAKFAVDKYRTPTMMYYSPSTGAPNAVYNVTYPANLIVSITPYFQCPASQTSTGCFTIGSAPPSVPSLIIAHWTAEAELQYPW
jgi:hypothetical protein